MTLSKILCGFLGLAGLTALAACSSDPTGTSPNQVLNDLVGIDSLSSSPGEPQEIKQLTRAAISKVDFPLMLISIPEDEIASTVTVAAYKGRTVTWVASDRVGVIMDGPVLFGTRGIGPDLLTADTDALVELLTSGKTGDLTRNFRHLNGLDQIDIRTFQCQLVDAGPETILVLERTHSTRKMQENCQSENGLLLENAYWLGEDGTLWKSQQWISSALGYMVTERLIK